MSLSVTVIVLDLGDIFHFFLDNASVDTHCRRVVAMILSLSALLAPGTSLLVVLVLLWVGGRNSLTGR